MGLERINPPLPRPEKIEQVSGKINVPPMDPTPVRTPVTPQNPVRSYGGSAGVSVSLSSDVEMYRRKGYLK